MTKEEFNSLEKGDIVYWAHDMSNEYTEEVVQSKEYNRIEFQAPIGCIIGIHYENIFKTEKEAKDEIIRRIKDRIATYVFHIQNNMERINNFDKDALDEDYLDNLETKLRAKFNSLKNK